MENCLRIATPLQPYNFFFFFYSYEKMSFEAAIIAIFLVHIKCINMKWEWRAGSIQRDGRTEFPVRRLLINVCWKQFCVTLTTRWRVTSLIFSSSAPLSIFTIAQYSGLDVEHFMCRSYQGPSTAQSQFLATQTQKLAIVRFFELPKD